VAIRTILIADLVMTGQRDRRGRGRGGMGPHDHRLAISSARDLRRHPAGEGNGALAGDHQPSARRSSVSSRRNGVEDKAVEAFTSHFPADTKYGAALLARRSS